jgi:hypothetical protein
MSRALLRVTGILLAVAWLLAGSLRTAAANPYDLSIIGSPSFDGTNFTYNYQLFQSAGDTAAMGDVLTIFSGLGSTGTFTINAPQAGQTAASPQFSTTAGQIPKWTRAEIPPAGDTTFSTFTIVSPLSPAIVQWRFSEGATILASGPVLGPNPEPSTLILLGAGIAGAAALRKKKRSP